MQHVKCRLVIVLSALVLTPLCHAQSVPSAKPAPAPVTTKSAQSAASASKAASSSVAKVEPSVTPNLRPGLWRMAVAMTLPKNIGPVPDPGPIQTERCVTREQGLEMMDIPKGVPCTMLERNATPSKLFMRFQCVQQGVTSVATSEIFFEGERIKAKMVADTAGAQNIRIITELSGRYIGPCAPKEVNRPSGELKGYVPK